MSVTREEWSSALLSRVGGTRRPVPLRNVVERVAAVLHGSELVFVDNALQGQSAVSGRITVFTDEVVAVVDVDGVASSNGSTPNPDQGTAAVVFVPRSALVRMDVRPDPDSPYVNSGDAWSSRDARGGWPHGARAELVYAGLDGRVVLPSEDPVGFDSLLPSLVRDLSR
jgi:hypothetical protein